MVNSYSDSAKNFPLRGESRVVPKQLSPSGRVARNADSSFPLRGVVRKTDRVVRNADSSFPLRGEWRVAPREDLYFLITQESGRYEIYGEGFLL